MARRKREERIVLRWKDAHLEVPAMTWGIWFKLVLGASIVAVFWHMPQVMQALL